MREKHSRKIEIVSTYDPEIHIAQIVSSIKRDGIKDDGSFARKPWYLNYDSNGMLKKKEKET